MCQSCQPLTPHPCATSAEILKDWAEGGEGLTLQPADTGAATTETADLPNNDGTGAALADGEFFLGTLETNGDSDWVAVTLEAGVTYTFAMVGVGATTNRLSDTYLRLRDDSGTEIAFNDDGGPGRDSILTFTASSSGTFYLDAQSWNNSRSGDYGLSMVEGTRASYNAEMGAGNLLRPARSWANEAETPVTVTWAIRQSGDDGNGFIAPSSAQVAAIENAMAYLDGISGLTLDQVNPGGTSNNATMLFASYSANDGSGAYAYYPSGGASGGDVWLNNNSVSTSSLNIGSYSYFTVLHEIGHAIGLAHPGEYNAAPGVSITYNNNAQFIEDSHQYTVMSYFDERNTTTSVGGYPDTFMLHDILAIHELYGADMSFHAGDTTYGFNATVGGAYDFNVNTNPLMTIWDGGGSDTIDLSGWSMAQTLNLTPGSFSNVGGYTANLSIAIGAQIENIVGGGGGDALDGNDIANTISGSAGLDTITGGGGDDQLLGNLSDDRIEGDEGNDFAHGGQDNDHVEGGAGLDTVDGGKGNDTVYGGTDADRVVGGDGADFLYGNQGEDTLLAGNGNDWMHGGQDNDNLQGGDGADTMNGGYGDDYVYGGDGADQVEGFLGDDFLFGNTGNDTLDGGQDDDWMHGGKDNDSLIGGSGSDTLNGGLGSDTMTGGTHVDEFRFWEGSGADQITDFQDNIDHILFNMDGISTVEQALAAATQVGNDVVFDFGGGDTLTILGMQRADLQDDLYVI